MKKINNINYVIKDKEIITNKGATQNKMQVNKLPDTLVKQTFKFSNVDATTIKKKEMSKSGPKFEFHPSTNSFPANHKYILNPKSYYDKNQMLAPSSSVSTQAPSSSPNNRPKSNYQFQNRQLYNHTGPHSNNHNPNGKRNTQDRSRYNSYNRNNNRNSGPQRFSPAPRYGHLNRPWKKPNAKFPFTGRYRYKYKPKYKKYNPEAVFLTRTKREQTEGIDARKKISSSFLDFIKKNPLYLDEFLQDNVSVQKSGSDILKPSQAIIKKSSIITVGVVPVPEKKANTQKGIPLYIPKQKQNINAIFSITYPAKDKAPHTQEKVKSSLKAKTTREKKLIRVKSKYFFKNGKNIILDKYLNKLARLSPKTLYYCRSVMSTLYNRSSFILPNTDPSFKPRPYVSSFRLAKLRKLQECEQKQAEAKELARRQVKQKERLIEIALERAGKRTYEKNRVTSSIFDSTNKKL